MISTDLRARRERLGLTQTQLAQALGLTQNTVSRWEIGKTAIQHPEILSLALEALESRMEIKPNPIDLSVLAERVHAMATPEDAAEVDRWIESVREQRAILAEPKQGRKRKAEAPPPRLPEPAVIRRDATGR